MALFSDDAGKTEKPTPKRMGEARNRGQVALSHELVMAGTLLVGTTMLATLGPWLLNAFQTTLARGMRLPSPALHDGEPLAVLTHVLEAGADVAPPVLLLVAILFVCTLLLGYGQIGLRLATEAVGFRLERLSPIANLRRVFHPTSVFRTLFAIVKINLLTGVLWWTIHDRLPDFVAMHGASELTPSLALIADQALSLLFWVAAAVLVLSVADVAWQRFSWQKNLMMTKPEVEDERKLSEGDPLIKRRLRDARLELTRHRMMAAVPKADVVISNPTHFAVALRYERGRSAAPQVVAKGADELALRIRELARQHRIPIMEDPPLARALWRSVKVGEAIPERFFRAVAAILSHVYRLKGRIA